MKDGVVGMKGAARNWRGGGFIWEMEDMDRECLL